MALSPAKDHSAFCIALLDAVGLLHVFSLKLSCMVAKETRQ